MKYKSSEALIQGLDGFEIWAAMKLWLVFPKFIKIFILFLILSINIFFFVVSESIIIFFIK